MRPAARCWACRVLWITLNHKTLTLRSPCGATLAKAGDLPAAVEAYQKSLTEHRCGLI